MRAKGHYSLIILMSFHNIRQNITFVSLEWKMLSLLDRFLFEWVGTKKCPPLREWQERGQNDHQSLAKEGQTVRKEGQTTLDSQSFPFSFLSFGPPSSFEGPSESFRKDRNFSNDLRRRSKRGEGWEKSRVISPIENHHSCLILPSFWPNQKFLESERPKQHKKMLEWPLNDKNDHFPRSAIILTSFNNFWVILTHLRAIPSFLCFQTTTEWKLFSFDYHLTMISIFPLGPVWACPRVWMFLLYPEVRLGWARGTSLEWPF